ncbi:MAG: hypothetical protein JWN75_107 [Candidatus Saccharibacteria bacterium]|nr:hypothetical protein [Candidatus Saccharibacteria bacterium]
MGMETKHDEDDAQRIQVNKSRETQVGPANNSNDKFDNSSVTDEDTELSAEYDKLIAESDTQDTEREQPSPASLKIVPIEEPKSSFNLHKYFLYTLVGGLIISALISVIAVLTGEFSSTMSRALGTTGSMVVHALILLFLVSVNSRKKSDSFVLNTILLIIVASFITSVLGIWGVIDSQMSSNLYLVYVYSFFASLWTQLLLKVGENLLDKPTRVVSFISIGFTGLFYLLVLPTAFIHYPNTLPEFLYRAMAASAILLATTSVLTTVFRRIYLFKHHELKSSSKTAWDIIVACIVLFVGLPLIFSVISALSAYNSSDKYIDDYSSTQSSKHDATPTPSATPTQSTEVTVPKTYPVNDCSNLNEFKSLNVALYSNSYTFKSHDSAQKQIIAGWQDDGLNMEPITYKDKLLVVDLKCNIIDASTLKSGDQIAFYLREGYSDLYKDALVILQKVN